MLLIVTLATKPPVHWLWVLYVTWQLAEPPPPPPPLEEIVQLNVADPEAPVPSVAVTVTLDVPGRGGRPGDQPGRGADGQARGQPGGA